MHWLWRGRGKGLGGHKPYICKIFEIPYFLTFDCFVQILINNTMSINYEMKTLNGISQATNITQRFPPAWSQTLQCLSSLCCSFRNRCMQTKCLSKDRSSQCHSSHQAHQPQNFPNCYRQQQDDRGPEQENSFLSQSDLREEKPCFQSARATCLGFNDYNGKKPNNNNKT